MSTMYNGRLFTNDFKMSHEQVCFCQAITHMDCAQNRSNITYADIISKMRAMCIL
jgi:hypothetical protein